MTATTRAPQVFYTYENAEGRIVIVDSLDQVPDAVRPRVERIAASAGSQTRAWSVLPGEFHAPSFGLGFGSALLAIGALTLLVRSRRMLGALVGLGLALVAGATYLGWLRRTTGQDSSGALIASPQQIIQDAKRAVERAKLQQAERDREIEQIQKEAK